MDATIYPTSTSYLMMMMITTTNDEDASGLTFPLPLIDAIDKSEEEGKVKIDSGK